MITRILAPLDGSSLAECVLPHLVLLTRATDAEVLLVRVLESGDSDPQPNHIDPLDWHLRKAEAETYLAEVQKRLQQEDVSASIELLQGRAAEQIVELARERVVDLILLSSHGRSGLSGWNVSSSVQKIIFRANTSFMIVPAYAGDDVGPAYERILVPLDGSKRAETVFPTVKALAQSCESVCLLASVILRPEMPRQAPLTAEDLALSNRIVERNRSIIEPYLEELEARLDVETETRLVVAENLIGALHDLAEGEAADLVALSAHGYSGQRRRPFGSVATSFIVHGGTPLLIVQDMPQDEIEASQAELAMGQKPRLETAKERRMVGNGS